MGCEFVNFKTAPGLICAGGACTIMTKRYLPRAGIEPATFPLGGEKKTNVKYQDLTPFGII